MKSDISQIRNQVHRFIWCEYFRKMLIKLVVRGGGKSGGDREVVVMLVGVSKAIKVKRTLQAFVTF